VASIVEVIDVENDKSPAAELCCIDLTKEEAAGEIAVIQGG
jgi:hypothetical protein